MLYIYGTGNNGLVARKILKEKNDREIDGYLDSFRTGEFDEKQIYSILSLSKEDIIVIAIASPHEATKVYMDLYKQGFSHLYWFYETKGRKRGLGDFFEDDCINMMEWGDCVLPYVDFHLSDKCNLNCKCCDHFSPLFDDIGEKFDKRIKDIYLLREKFSNVAQIMLLGGEPLLSDEVDKYVITVREVFPHSSIVLLTNGLLVPTLSDKVCQSLVDNNIIMEISEYIPTHKIMDQIITKLNEFGIPYRIRPLEGKVQFKKSFSVNKNTKYNKSCISIGCNILANGKIARCASLMYVYRFNEYFQQSLPTEGIIDLSSMTGPQILEALEEKVPLCDYCIDHFVDWERCGKEKHLEDFADLD